MKKFLVFFGLLLVVSVNVVSIVYLLKPLEPVAKSDQATSDQEEAQPDGPLSFWNGEVVIGEGSNRGKIELLAAPGAESVVLTADEDGVCKFDSIPSMKLGEMYIRLQKRGHAPLLSIAPIQKGKEVEMHPVYQLSRAVKEGKITPLIAPDIMPPAEAKDRQQGQHLEGFTWSIASYGMQVYGREIEEDPTTAYTSTAIELTPVVQADLEPFEIDLTKSYFTDEKLAEMSVADRRFDDYDDRYQNGLKEFQTSVGVFKVVSSCDRQSIDPNAKHGGGLPLSTLQLPNGKWMSVFFDIQQIVELDGQLYLICNHQILRWISNETLECVATFEGLATRWQPYICRSKTEDGWLVGRYLAVNKSNESNFGGLLEYREGKWMFHQYDGDYGNWVETAEEQDDKFVLTLWKYQNSRSAPRVEFDPGKGIFRDL